MKIKSIEDVIAWQKAKTLCIDIYNIFRNNKDYSFRDQIQRVSVSVMNNTAEGFERSGDKELKYFLYVAKGSCGEVRSMLHLAKGLHYISEPEFKKLEAQSAEISRIIAGFIKTL